MSSTSPVTIVDCIQADLAANASSLGMKPKLIRSYAEPIVLLPAKLPALAVWCEVTDYRLITTMPSYERSHDVNIGWYVSNPKQSDDGGVGDPQVVHDLDQTIEKLVTHLATYSDGIPGIPGVQLVATLKSRVLSPGAGTLWRGLVTIDVEEAA